MKNYNIEEIFTPKAFPQYTYIERKISGGKTYESQLKQAIFADESIIYILGAYKSGKSTLYKNVIADSKLIKVSGIQIRGEYDLWEQISLSPCMTQKAQYEKNVVDTTDNIIDELIQQLINKNKILVIDDFQYINQKTQARIISTLRAKTLRGLKIIIVSVIHQYDHGLLTDTLSTNNVSITPWKSKELEEIAYKGFSLLKVNITDCGINMLTRESIACPQLMQENCYKLAMFCREHQMREVTDETARKIIPYIKNIDF